MNYSDMNFTMVRDPGSPLFYHLVVYEPIERELYRHNAPPKGLLPTDRMPGDPSDVEIAAETARVRAAHLAAKAAAEKLGRRSGNGCGRRGGGEAGHRAARAGNGHTMPGDGYRPDGRYSEREPRAVRVSPELAAIARSGGWDVMGVADMSGRGGVGEGGW